MNRKYSRDFYLKLVETARKIIPNLGLYTDIIVGFPGESEKDFQDTVAIVERVEFDGAFIFKYSPRERTTAAQLKETVSEAEKVERLQILNKIQNQITQKRDKKLIGKIESIIVEGASKKAKPNQYMGRTAANKIIVFNTQLPPKARMAQVKIIDVKGHTLFGELVESTQLN